MLDYLNRYKPFFWFTSISSVERRGIFWYEFIHNLTRAVLLRHFWGRLDAPLESPCLWFTRCFACITCPNQNQLHQTFCLTHKKGCIDVGLFYNYWILRAKTFFGPGFQYMNLWWWWWWKFDFLKYRLLSCKKCI